MTILIIICYAFGAIATLAAGLGIIARARARHDLNRPDNSEVVVAAILALIAALVWPLVAIVLLLYGIVEAEARFIRRRRARDE